MSRVDLRTTRPVLTAVVLLVAAVVWFTPAPASEQPSENQARATDRARERRARLVSDFSRYAEQAMAAWGVPGMAVAVVNGDKVIMTRGFGVRTKGGRQPVDGGTVFQIGSITKGMTAALVGRMVDRGLLAWNDRVADRLPGFSLIDPWAADDFRIWDLLTQHSGLTEQAVSHLPLFGFTRADLIPALGRLEPSMSFRTEYAYQNGFFVVAGRILELISGSSWEDLLSREILTPLGMRSTTSRHKAFLAAPNRVSLHRRKGGSGFGRVTAVPDEWPFHGWVDAIGPAGGLNAPVTDLIPWLRQQWRQPEKGRLPWLKAGTRDFIHSPKTIIHSGPTGRRDYYSLGWMFSTGEHEPIVWHTGGTLGCSTIIAFAPRSGVGIVVLTNLAGSGLPRALAWRFFDQWFDLPDRDRSARLMAERDRAAKARPRPVRPAKPAPALDPERYTGRYHNPVYGVVEVRRKNAALVVVIGPGRVEVPLSHWDRDVFQASLPRFRDRFGFVRFSISHNGRASEMLITELNKGRAGQFRRLEGK